MPNATIYGRTSAGEYLPVAVDANGNLVVGGGTSVIGGTATVKDVRATTGAGTAIAGTVTGGTLLPSNANRLGATLYYDGTARLYVNLGTALAAVGTKTLEMGGSAYLEVPFNYTGVVTVAASANGGTVYGTTLT